MSDLSEAIEWWADNKGFLWQMIPDEEWAHIERGMAAARNWHTLTNPDNVQVIDRCAEAIKTEWSNGGTTDDAYVLAIVVLDALTDTARDDA